MIYFACDTYKDQSIKAAEREKRGSSEELVLRSSKMKIPGDFQKFLNNNKNKERLFELIEETYIQHKEKLNSRRIFFVRTDTCKMITTARVEISYYLNHEEADTKLINLVKHAMVNEENQRESVFVVRSSSGDIDIPVIMLSSNLRGNIIIDNGRSNHRKNLFIDECTLTPVQKKALIGLHSYWY